MLSALMGGRALCAGELAYAARVSPPTASAHLAKLVEARLIAPQQRGRHRYFRLASAKVAQMLEGLMAVAIDGPPRYRPPSLRDQQMRSARTCYDHLAGRLGVALADGLAARGHVAIDPEGGEVTQEGARFFTQFGIDLAAAKKGRRHFLKPCLDWSERRLHIGGAVGAALAGRAFALGWIERVPDSRAVALTADGRAGFRDVFGLASGTVG
jgi:Bacterial regulatory protein, arsR family